MPPQWRRELERRLGVADRALPAAARAAAEAEGRRWSLDEATRYALREGGSDNRISGSPLTAREREVATWLAQGFTNRQVADALVVSPETVAVHVKHILSKLGLHSRAQVAAWVAQQDGDSGSGRERGGITPGYPAPPNEYPG
jgi:non-specific serine/threonine protein kinase